MNRPQEILTRLLDVAHDWSGPVDEAVLHAQINARVTPEPALAEFRHALKTAENEGWISPLDSKRRGTLWTITLKGEAERVK